MSNQVKKFVNGKVVTIYSPFRSLDNYKKIHSELAKEKNVYKDLIDSKTLTQARKVLFGFYIKRVK